MTSFCKESTRNIWLHLVEFVQKTGHSGVLKSSLISKDEIFGTRNKLTATKRGKIFSHKYSLLYYTQNFFAYILNRVGWPGHKG